MPRCARGRRCRRDLRSANSKRSLSTKRPEGICLDRPPRSWPEGTDNYTPHGEEALAPSRTMRPQTVPLILRDARESALLRMRITLKFKTKGKRRHDRI